MRNILLSFILLLSFQLPEIAKERNIKMPEADFGGFRFSANEVEIEDRSTLKIFNNAQKFPKDSMIISCDLSLTGDQALGHVFSCKSPEGETIFSLMISYSLTQANTFDFRLNFPAYKRQLILSIPLSICYERVWVPFTIGIYPKEKRALFRFEDIEKTCELTEDFRRQMKSQKVEYYFGKCADNLDLVQFSIKNLIFQADKKKTYIPLTETSGTDVHAIDGSIIGTATNPNWLYSTHFKWETITEFEENEIAAVYQNPIKHTIHCYTSKNVYTFDNRTNRFHIQKHKSEDMFQAQKGGGFNYWYDFRHEKLFIYNNGSPVKNGKQVALYNQNKDEISYLGNSWTPFKFHHSSTFVGDDDRYIYQFGGYIGLLYSNKLFKIDRETGKSEEMHFSGDTISPRFYTSVYPDVTYNKEEIYLFGGYGNESGIQADGGQYLSDFYRIDLKSKKIEQVCDFNIKYMDKVPCRNLILGEDGHSFYTLCYSYHTPESNARLYRFDWKNKEYYTLSDSISFVSKWIPTKINLFEDKESQSLIAVIQAFKNEDQATIKICRLATPVMPLEYANIIQKETHKNHTRTILERVTWIIVLSLLIILIATWLIYEQKRKKTEKKTEEVRKVIESIPEEIQQDEKPRVNTIFLLGDFTVFDKDAKDITYLFSSKIRQLFLLILLNSVRDNSKGISSNEISSILWPDKELTKSKNIRAVTMKNLREALSSMEGIKIVYEAGKWTTVIDQDVCHCDFIEVLNPKFDFTGNPSYEHIRPYINLLRRGSFMKTEEYDWMDLFKSEFEDKALTLYGKIMKHAYELNDYKTSYKIAVVLLNIDSLNKNLMKIEINSLIHMGDSVKALVKFRQFSLNYYEAYKENLKFEDYADK